MSRIEVALKAKFHPRRVFGEKVGLTQSCLLLPDPVLQGVGVPGSSSGMNDFCANCGATVTVRGKHKLHWTPMKTSNEALGSGVNPRLYRSQTLSPPSFNTRPSEATIVHIRHGTKPEQAVYNSLR